MRQLNLTINSGITDLWVKCYDDTKRDVPVSAVLLDRWVLRFDNGDPSSGGLNMRIAAMGYREWRGRMTMPPDDTQVEAGIVVELEPGAGPFPGAPTRDELLGGQITMQGLMVESLQFGEMPWFPACWAWLTREDRAFIARQLLAHGDTIALIQLPDGIPLYDEPAPNFYTVDKFPALDMTHGNTQIDPEFIDLIIETLGLGFKGVWIFLGGDDGERGFPVAIQQTNLLGPALANVNSVRNLNEYVVQVPGWDGVFYGYTPQHVADFATAARAAGAIYVGLEHSTGHIPLGEGGSDYQPGGLMTGFDLVLGEFDDGRFDDTVWEILGRMVRPYLRPPEQPADDDPDPPYYLRPDSPRGRYVYRIFEYYIFGGVRGVDPSVIHAAKAKLQSMAPNEVIC